MHSNYIMNSASLNTTYVRDCPIHNVIRIHQNKYISPLSNHPLVAIAIFYESYFFSTNFHHSDSFPYLSKPMKYQDIAVQLKSS